MPETTVTQTGHLHVMAEPAPGSQHRALPAHGAGEYSSSGAEVGLLASLQSLLILFFFFINFFNVYLFLRQGEAEHERGRVRERGRHRIGNRLQAPSHQPRA